MNMAGREETIGLEHFTPGLDCLETPFSLSGNPDSRQNEKPVKALEPIQPQNFAKIQADREKSAVKTALSAAEGNVTKAAKSLGISRQLLHYKIKKYRFYRMDFIRRPTI